MSKVFLGMSGGVDSSVAAALLKKQGHAVTGVFIKVWHPDFLPCDWKTDRLDAMRVCAHLDIPFVTLDLSTEYKRDVVDYMISEYREGRTPNPDVMCNRSVKFGAFWQWAKAQGAESIATGHYARTGNQQLFQSPDSGKDQTYFLWKITADDLAHVLFPLGTYTKPEVRALAERYALPTAAKKDSQGLCFVGKVDMKEFLQHFITRRPGAALSLDGHTIGTHDGALFYTIGERHGFTITQKTNTDAPYYVVSKDVSANTITVSAESRAQSGTTTVCTLTETNWIRVPNLSRETITAQIRYHQEMQACTLVIARDTTRVTFTNPQTAALGQSIVFYAQNECIGGGVISQIAV